MRRKRNEFRDGRGRESWGSEKGMNSTAKRRNSFANF